jgi:hypothetical protein
MRKSVHKTAGSNERYKSLKKLSFYRLGRLRGVDLWKKAECSRKRSVKW